MTKNHKKNEGGKHNKILLGLEEQMLHLLPSRNEAVAFAGKHYLSHFWTDRQLAFIPISIFMSHCVNGLAAPSGSRKREI